MRKLSLKYIKNSFEKENYKLLITEYVNSNQKLDYICDKGHKHSTTWLNWRKGHRCPHCAGLAKKDIKFVRQSFELSGYKLLTLEYINAHQKLDYVCPEGHSHSITWNNWQRGQRCPYCAGNGKEDISFIKSKFEKEGYTFLTNKYINCTGKLNYICPNGHRHSISWDTWKNQHQRCPYCAGNAKLTIEFIRLEFAKEHYKLLTKKYINCDQKLDYICSEGHIGNISWDSWKQGKRCVICGHIKVSGSNHPNWKGGISCEPYCDVWLDKEFKESIKERDNYICQNPDCWGTSKRLDIHHIDYVKKNCKPNNLITLCRSCNSRANVNRKWHTDWYRIIMNKKHGYCYE